MISGRRTRWAAVIVSVIVASTGAIALSGCSRQASSPSADGEFSYISGDGSTTILPASQRKPAPALAAKTLEAGAFDGATFDLAAQKGKVVVLNVWASWCAECRVEAPALARIAPKLAGDGVEFVGLNTRDSGASAQAYVDRFAVPYPSLDDTDGQLQVGFRDTGLPILSVPTTIVIDKQGRVAARALGSLDESRVRGLVEPLLREK